MLADAGIPLGCQTVLLRGVNDRPHIMTALMRKLLSMRVKPYYLHHADPVKGTGHFRTSIDSGLNIMKALRSRVSGLCVPQYVIDLPAGGGKVPLTPAYVKKISKEILIVENHEGKRYEYPLD